MNSISSTCFTKKSMTLVTWMNSMTSIKSKGWGNSIDAFSSMNSITSMEWSGWIDSINSACSGPSIRSMGWSDWKAWITSTSPITSQSTWGKPISCFTSTYPISSSYLN